MTNLIYAPLLWALIQVESDGKASAHNKKEDARGVLQIRNCVVNDVNFYYNTSFSHDDCWDIEKSLKIATLYLTHWGKKYSYITGKAATPEILARIWNGGPNGYRKESTKDYWKRVKIQLSHVDTLHICIHCGIPTRSGWECLSCEKEYANAQAL